MGSNRKLPFGYQMEMGRIVICPEEAKEVRLIFTKYGQGNSLKTLADEMQNHGITYVPMMIEMGIDIWQGGTVKNDISALVKQYGGQISFLTGIEAADVDHEGWTREEIRNAVRKICKACGNQYFIPCQTAGGPSSVFEGVYQAIDEEIDALNREMFPGTF